MNTKQAARLAKRNAARDAAIEQQFADHNLIPKEQVAQIRELLNKLTRTEEEWTVIKDILSSHSLIVVAPTRANSKIKIINHMLVDEGRLIAFTNMDDAAIYIKNYIKKNFPEGIYFQMGSLPFEQAVETSDKKHMDLFIDPPVEPHVMYLYYSKGRITAAMLTNP